VGSIPDSVTGFFHWHNPSGRTMALASTQSLTEMSTGNISWGKGGRCVELTTLPPSCTDCLKIWEPQTSGSLRACQGLWWDCFTSQNFSMNFGIISFTLKMELACPYEACQSTALRGSRAQKIAVVYRDNILLIIITYLTASGLSPGGSGYYECT
jgi:hypothetical protein